MYPKTLVFTVFSGILNILYEEKKLNFLGNKKDEKAKIILKPKEVVSKDFFIKLCINSKKMKKLIDAKID